MWRRSLSNEPSPKTRLQPQYSLCHYLPRPSYKVPPHPKNPQRLSQEQNAWRCPPWSNAFTIDSEGNLFRLFPPPASSIVLPNRLPSLWVVKALDKVVRMGRVVAVWDELDIVEVVVLAYLQSGLRGIGDWYADWCLGQSSRMSIEHYPGHTFTSPNSDLLWRNLGYESSVPVVIDHTAVYTCRGELGSDLCRRITAVAKRKQPRTESIGRGPTSSNRWLQYLEFHAWPCTIPRRDI